MTKFKKGDAVIVLDEAFEGKVIDQKGTDVTIETTDGFVLVFQSNELILNRKQGLNFNIPNQNIDEIIKQKEIPKPRSFEKVKKTKEQPVPEFDLHIEKLVKNYKSMNNYEILTLQTETAKRHIDFAIKNRIPKIVLIHGVGEGVLKSELDFMLSRYDNIIYQDANYQKYGLGATEIYIKQSAMN